jgi:cytosine/uracil/thiamine/allantoin permease
MAELVIVDNARPEVILHVMFPVVSGASFGFWGNLRGVFSREYSMVGHMILARCGHLGSTWCPGQY